MPPQIGALVGEDVLDKELTKLENAIQNINAAFEEFMGAFRGYVEKLTELEGMMERLKRDRG